MNNSAKRPLEPESEGSINISVKGQDGISVYFKISRTVPMLRILQKFCQKRNIEYTTTRFFYNGERFSSRKTPAELGMEDKDEIDAMRDQSGGGFGVKDNTSRNLKYNHKGFIDQDSSGCFIKLIIKSQEGDSVFFEVPRTSEISKVLRSFCRKKNYDYDSTRFLYDGARISAKLTADDLGMEDNDEIDAMMEQTGGCSKGNHIRTCLDLSVVGRKEKKNKNSASLETNNILVISGF